MNALLQQVLDAYGGLGRWRKLKRFESDMSIVGGLWARKGWPEVLRSVHVTGDCHGQRLTYSPFAGQGKSSEYTPERVVVTTEHGQITAERHLPRDAFDGHTLSTPWDELHLAYFSGYAMWNYLTTPFIFTLDGVQTQEIEPWEEDGARLRRLQVTFPEDIITHSREQTFYVDERGLMTRVDYSSRLTGGEGATVAHYMCEHRVFSGIVVPTHRRAHPRVSDGTVLREHVLVAIDIASVEFS